MIENEELRELVKEAHEEGIDTQGVLLFASKMLERLEQARGKGRSGWYDKSNRGLLIELLRCEIKELKGEIIDFDTIDEENEFIQITALAKEELIDIANFCMFLYYNGELQ